jgi:hypothetical protein
MNTHDRFKNFDKTHCWQYEMRLQNLEIDLVAANLTKDSAAQLRTGDFKFAYVDKSDKALCKEIKDFIVRHEWLGKLPNRPTHRFVARVKNTNVLAGVIIMATPNAFSNLLGKENTNREKLISRGACISWAPKNLGSWLIMQSIKWMVKNTDFRYFTAYSDPEAKELGTIYQACNFYYLGQTSGTTYQYLDPIRPEKGWFSDREFRKKSKYYRYAKAIGIDKATWSSWMNKYSPNWSVIPPNIKKDIKTEEKRYRDGCKKRSVPPKHKYCYILGQTKTETKRLKIIFSEQNPKKTDLSYPIARGK